MGAPFHLPLAEALRLTRRQVRKLYLRPRDRNGEPDLEAVRPQGKPRPAAGRLLELGRGRNWPDWYTERWVERMKGARDGQGRSGRA